jgi:hypothetical protein
MKYRPCCDLSVPKYATHLKEQLRALGQCQYICTHARWELCQHYIKTERSRNGILAAVVTAGLYKPHKNVDTTVHSWHSFGVTVNSSKPEVHVRNITTPTFNLRGNRTRLLKASLLNRASVVRSGHCALGIKEQLVTVIIVFI